MSSSVKPSLKYSCDGSPVRFSNGSTASVIGAASAGDLADDRAGRRFNPASTARRASSSAAATSGRRTREERWTRREASRRRRGPRATSPHADTAAGDPSWRQRSITAPSGAAPCPATPAAHPSGSTRKLGMASRVERPPPSPSRTAARRAPRCRCVHPPARRAPAPAPSHTACPRPRSDDRVAVVASRDSDSRRASPKSTIFSRPSA